MDRLQSKKRTNVLDGSGAKQMKVADRKKLKTSKVRQLESTATSQSIEQQASDHVVKEEFSIRSVLPSSNGNKVTSKRRRKLGNRSKQKEANSSMWQVVEEEWKAYQEASKKGSSSGGRANKRSNESNAN